MAQVIDQYAIRIGFQLNAAQMASVQRMVSGFVGGLNGKVAPAIGRTINTIQTTTRQSLAVLDAAVARTSKLGMDLSTRLSLPMAAFAGYGIKVAAEIEQANLTLEALTGSSEEATRVQKQLNDYATSTSFNIQNVMSNANRLLATGATNPAGIQKMVELFGALSMGDNEKFDRIAYAFGQINTAGRLMGTEGKQLSEALVNIYPILEKMRGLGKGTVNSGTVAGFNFTKDEVLQAMTILAKEGPFFKIMEKRSGSLSVALSGLVERFYLFAGAIGESLRKAIGLDGILKGIGKTFERVQKILERMTDGQKKLLVSVGLFLIAVGPLTYLLSVWMRTGAMLLRVFGGIKAAFIGLKAINKGGGIMKVLFGGTTGAAFLVVLKTAAVMGAIYLILDEIVTWANGGNTIIGKLFGERWQHQWIFDLLTKTKDLMATTVVKTNKFVDEDPSLQRFFRRQKEIRREGHEDTRYRRAENLGAIDVSPFQYTLGRPYFTNNQQKQPLLLKLPGLPLAQGAADTLSRMGILAAPQNTYITKLHLDLAGAGLQ